MLPQVPVVRVTDSQEMPLPSYVDGVGTCMILRSNEMEAVKIAPQHFEVFTIGFAMALPVGMEAQIRSLKDSSKTGLIVLNAPATIDASDRGEITVCLFNASQESVIINRGDPIAMMVFSLALRVQWLDLTQQIVDKIHKKKAESQKQAEQQKKDDGIDIPQIIPHIIEEKSSDTDYEDTQEVEEISQETLETSPELTEEIVSEPESVIEEVLTPSIVEETKEQTAPSIEMPAILSDEPAGAENIEETFASADTEPQMILPVKREITKDDIDDDVLSNENYLVDEPITPPAILEEFEKIENEFDTTQVKDDS